MPLTETTCKFYGITDKRLVKKIQRRFSNNTELMKYIINSPYSFYCGIAEWSFNFADKYIIKRWPESYKLYERCEYAMQYVIESYCNTHGDTKMSAELMFNEVAKLVGGNCNHIMDCLGSAKFHYDENEKTITLTKYYQSEKNIADAIKKRLDIRTEYDWDIESYRETDEMTFTDEQMAILRLARDNKIAILSGSAGTGKSAVTKALATMLEDNGQNYKMLAPTGIAAKRLREATGKDAMTIHRYLLSHAESHLDYLIIDEFSMVGVELLSALLNHPSVTDETTLIFICDEAQLASISPGNIIKNMLDDGKIPMAKLTYVFRYGIGGIATIATDIRYGQEIDFNKGWKDAVFMEYGNYPLEVVIDCINDALTRYDVYDILLLTPKKIGALGTYVLNGIIQGFVNPNGKKFKKFDYIIKDRGIEYHAAFREGDKVINTKNNYSAMTSNGDNALIMNGEIGIVTKQKNINGDDCLCVRFDNDEIAYNKKEIRNLQLAYAMTCHKVQGQQAKCVIFLAHEESAFMLTRNLMYVAVSRAQEMLYIISKSCVISSGIDKVETNKRKTYLNKLLEEDLN